MKTYRFDVVIVGAGPAGVAAAGALAGSGVSVALIEAGAYAGAENWSGCVYFAESLAEPDCFGPAAVQNAPFERQVVRRGTLLHNGLDEIGVALTDPAAFRHCYTVLRPVYDPYFADLARSRGAMLITDTTVTSLIRKNGWVAGVNTDRGPVHAGVVFLAEGDASHLVRSEGLERAREPHYLQGVKAVLSLPQEEIEKRFDLRGGEGAAFELLLRNGSIAGRTARLNVGGFLYTNRESLSVGYVVPLDNLRKHFRGDHSRLLEWMRGLPHLREMLENATLTSYGAKIIRSGGWRERPVLVEDGLAVGGASTGLGIDIPFPNFTGPASASGLFFARAVRRLLKDGRSFDARNLTGTYLRPLQESVYGRNARHLSRWPGYFSRSSVLFGRTVDAVCGTARFLSSGEIVETGRFLRSHILSLRGLREFFSDKIAAAGALRLWKPLVKTLFHPATLGSWFANMVRRSPKPDPRLRFIMNVAGNKADPFLLPWPLGGLVRRIAPSLAEAIAAVYANDDVPVEKKFGAALRALLRSVSITDLVTLPLFVLTLFLASLGTAIVDAFRFYVLKVPVEKFLSSPVMSYAESQRKARDIDAVKPAVTLEAKLGLNTYRVGSTSHIRTLWPEAIASHADMAKAGLWWVCPARVYTYDAPLFGRGRVGVNWENCIKCESCWRAEPSFALWGRFTDHRLIYRPATSAVPLLLETRRALLPAGAQSKPATADERLWYAAPAAGRTAGAVLAAISAFDEALAGLPASADKTRTAWPLGVGKRLADFGAMLEKTLRDDGHRDAADRIRADREATQARLGEGRLFHARYAASRMEEQIRSWFPDIEERNERKKAAAPTGSLQNEARELFPDRVVKEWEEAAMPEAWAEKLRSFIGRHRHPSRPAIRALSSVSPALGLIAACQARAIRVLAELGKDCLPGLCALDAPGIEVNEGPDGAAFKGTLSLVPTAASTALLLIIRDRGYVVPLGTPGLTVTLTPSIGFRAAGLADVVLDCRVAADNVVALKPAAPHDPASYLAVALGAADYLSRRAEEHALGRIQFGGQMLDTEGRDGIAKLGAVKAMAARVGAWRLLLEQLYDRSRSLSHAPLRAPRPAFDLLLASCAAQAFGPRQGSLGYDAGQVFGGFAYSEDDLLSRFYRDSSLFPFLPAGLGASAAFDEAVRGKDLVGLVAAIFGPLPSREPMKELADRWNVVHQAYNSVPHQADAKLRGNAVSLLVGAAALIISADRDLASGKSSETKAAAAHVLCGLAEDAVMQAALSAGRGKVLPGAVFPVEPSIASVDLPLDYEGFCSLPGAPHRSGAFLLSVFDRSPRYVPEMQLHDRKLRQLWTELAGWFRRNCSDRQYDGRSFERYVEKVHSLPPEIIEAIKENKWLATYVSPAEDGLGWHKAGYYVLNSAAGSFGDAAICLLIMASTSIGTTPILLGLEDELPRVREELEPLALDEKRLGEIGSRISRIVASFKSPDPGRIRKEYEAAMQLVDGRIRKSRVVKYLGANFLRAFYGAGLAGQRGDFNGFMENLQRASELFTRLMPDVRAALEELPRRERCHRLHLRTLGHGGVSAFALTEPTAGSDSGGVKTTAQLRSAALAQLPDGRYSFTPAGGTSERFLIDADRIAFTDQGMAYRAPDNTLVQVRYDRYDRKTSRGVRTYEHQGARCEFHDIGQVRRTDKGLVYEYYEVTGSKMWITNGGVATQFALFAQTPEGVTGLMVDRFAEGLTVGADERKTGQRGSPTNELALDSVRVAREAVIGYEGHGQVNALETLNVGRCGLAAVAGALARKVLMEAREQLPQTPERDRLLGEAAAVQFGSESLAYYLIGLFDRPHESVRMESAIAKYACSEDIHEVLGLVEEAYGPEGQTEKHLIEKARRDARILNIYEGTNEVQRFLILKDLIAMAKDLPELPGKLSESPTDLRAMTLSRWKNGLRSRVRSAAGLLGDNAWADAMLQPGLFPLAETAGEILRLECVWLRMEWLEAQRSILGAGYVEELVAAGTRAAERTIARLDHLEKTFDRAWERIAKNIAPVEVHAADALFDRTGKPEAALLPAAQAARSMKVLCIARPVADLPPNPSLDRGELREILWKIDPLDRSCIDQALGLKAEGNSVTLDLLLAGGPEREELLRSEGAGADKFFRMDLERPDAASIAEAVKTLEEKGSYDLILCGAHGLDGSSGLAPFLAGRLKRSAVTREALAMDETAIIALTSPSPASSRTISSLIEAETAAITTVGSGAPAQQKPHSFTKPAAAAVETKTMTTVDDAAQFLKDYAAALRTSQAEPFPGEIGKAALPKDVNVWAILDPAGGRANVSALRAARIAGELFGRKAAAFIAAPRSQWPALLGLARANGMSEACCLDTKDGLLSETGRRHVLSALGAGNPMIFAGQGWNDAFAYAAGATGTTIPFLLNASEIKTNASGYPDVLLPAYEGKLLRNQKLSDGPAFLTFTSDAELAAAPAADKLKAVAVEIMLGPDMTVPLPPPAEPTLNQAEVIIDLGYGVHDKAGMQLAEELRKKLESMGLAPLFGATRKVTQDLKLLPLEAQIGQTGVRVNPKLIIALGISGAPQHIDWIGTRADVLSFNKDPEAPLMKLNQTRPAPRVHPILGDLFVTVRELIGKLG